MSDQITNDPRVFFAAVRTVLAWVRTSLALMGFGFVIARFGLFLRELAVVRPNAMGRAAEAIGSEWIGACAIVLGASMSLIAAFSYARFLQEHGHQPGLVKAMYSWPVLLASILGVLGLGLAFFLATQH
ncbi:MAG: DUF202 domain-containing protein [Capsulimonadaceae bacterium]|nr:DUF202 domain-containing protein [Capsulimonadaceae bacterium]